MLNFVQSNIGGIGVIEIVYSKDAEKEDELLRLPKNIRQIGLPDENKKIYIEDYAVTYINQLVLNSIDDTAAAILVGHTSYSNSCEYTFIHGIIEVRNANIKSTQIEFGQKVWTDIYDDIKRYFKNSEVVGWFLSLGGIKKESGDCIIKAHIDNFAGSDKVFMKLDALEDELIFYTYQNGRFVRQNGYYVYYEKNDEMQEYMLDRKEVKTEKTIERVSDRAAKSFRTIIQERKEEKRQKKIMTFMYTTSTFLVMLIAAIGVTMINNYDKMKSMEETLNAISKAVIIDGESTKESNSQSLKLSEDWFKTQEQADTKSESSDTGQDSKSSQIEVENVEGNVQMQEDLAQTDKEADSVDKNSGGKEAENKDSDEKQQNESKGAVTEISTSEEDMKNNLNGEGSSDDSQGESKEEPKDGTDKEPVKEEPRYYTVEEGDTLAIISMKMYNTNDMVEAICNANNIENVNKIMVGQKLLLP